MSHRTRRRSSVVVSAVLLSSLALSACGGESEEESGKKEGKKASANVSDPLAITYDGGVYVLDGESLDVVGDVPLEGYNRVSPAGDDKHIMVSTSEGFRVLDAAQQKMTDMKFEGAEPGHVVLHGGKTVLFTDGTGETRILDSDAFSDGEPDVETYKAPSPHHGVSIELENGELVTTLGTAKKRKGVVVLDKDRKEVTRNEECPEVHGEAAAKGEAVVVGCEDGVLIYKDGKIRKADSPDDYGRIGNQAGSEKSSIVLGDYKTDPEAELERPEQVSLVDTEKGKIKLVDLGTSYSFQSLARGPQGEALVLGTDGDIHVLDPESGKETDTIPAVGDWREPIDWQQSRPELWVREDTAYVTDPEKKKIHAIDLETGKKKATGTFDKKPNEVSGVTAS
ncbi:zinc metallochaperone AztD [Streptomyces sulphureus]|uniref:zinc metallochaperone AztD n=1 Tax=Streptomyces sulphureus TaxID=47758 RepID=UPI00039DB2D6|nr:zinc metallochaperone AztD [Streptomyces sulphureus]